MKINEQWEAAERIARLERAARDLESLVLVKRILLSGIPPERLP